MRLDLDVSQHQLSWEELLGRVRLAEEAGFGAAWVFDHFKPLYGDPSGPCLEAWTLLAALAAQTSRVRLGVMVTGVTYRHPSVLTAEAVTVDHVSGGRLELGLGAAWFEEEHRQLGIDFPPTRERAERLEEATQVMRVLMTTDGADFRGRYYRLERASYRPRPVQTPHPPVWIGASGEGLMLPIVGRQADVWNAFPPAGDIARKWAVVAEHAERVGRDPATIARSSFLSISEPWDQVRSQAEALRAAGVAILAVSWPGEGRPRIEEFVERVMPDLTRM